jgi:glycosyltransferase involved in cell wall biosynthesis
MVFHVVSLPHTVCDKAYCACAYTMKIFQYCRMMLSLGHTVYHYGAEGSTVECTEHITVITAEEQAKFFGGTDWHKETFPVKWDPSVEYWQLSNTRSATEIAKRRQKKDFVCLVGGNCQKPIADLLGEKDIIVVEPFVGYYGIFAKHRVFESYTHQSCVYGAMSSDPDGRLYDAVIPNYYDPLDFEIANERKDYLLYIGRLISRKGINIALEVAKKTGRKLIMAGQGVKTLTPNLLVTEEGIKIPLGSGVEYFGYAGVADRKKLMGEAHAVLMPTMFMEPFGGVAVETQLCGTPVITTDHAAFSETVKHGKTGFRCHTLEQFCWAVEHTNELLPPETIRYIALENYSIDKVKYMFQEYFQMLLGLWDQGWYKENPERLEMSWLEKS